MAIRGWTAIAARSKGEPELPQRQASGSKIKSMGAYDLDISLEGDDIIITLGRRFRAVYYKPVGYPRLILRQRTKSDDDELLDAVLNAANVKARKLGWIRCRQDAHA